MPRAWGSETTWGSDLLEVSPRARIIHAIPMNEVLSFDKTLSVVVPEHRERFQQAILAAVESKGSFNEDYQIQPFDGTKRKWLNSTGKVELNEKGEVMSVIGTILDITESKEDELRKNDFIGMVSHELKTPLTSLTAYIQVANQKLKSSNDSFLTGAMDKAGVQVKRMSDMINGFLNVSRLESAKLIIEKREFDLEELIEETIRETELTVNSHAILFSPCQPVIINADHDKLGSVVTNLISNAVKYSPKGKEIAVKCAVFDGQAQVSVKDEGMGLKAKDLDKVFDRYYRVESDDTRQISGFGIGLYLSAEIIHRHNGRI